MCLKKKTICTLDILGQVKIFIFNMNELFKIPVFFSNSRFFQV